jgi:hypothetical protein
MDHNAFDQFARLLGAAGTRRTALGALLGVGLTDASSALRARKNRRKARKRKARSVRSQAADCLSLGPGSNVNGCNYAGEDHSGEDLSGSAMVGTNFNNATLVDTDLSSSNMRNARFRNANLCSADLSSSTLRNADFRNANLTRADLSSSACGGAQFNAGTVFCQTIACNGSIRNDDCPSGVDPADVCCLDSDCLAGETCCAGECADLDSDTDNCGECGRECDAGEVCSNGFTCQDPDCLPITRTSGDVTLASDGGLRFNALAPSVFGAARIEVPAGTKFGDLASMSSEFEYLNGTDCGAGSPRFVVFLQNGRCPYGVFPPSTCGTPNASGNTGEMIGNNTPFEWVDDLCGGSGSTFYAPILTLYASEPIDRIALVVDDSQGDGGETVILNPCVTL